MSSHFGDEEYRSAATLYQSFVFFNLCNPLIYVNTQLLWQHFILHMDAYNILQMQRMFYFTHDYFQSLHSLMIIALSKHKQRNSFKTFLHHLLICYRNWCICYKMLDLEKATREQMKENNKAPKITSSQTIPLRTKIQETKITVTKIQLSPLIRKI